MKKASSKKCLNFITVGNDCPQIFAFNLRKLQKIYPRARVVLYDWGHTEKNKQLFKKIHPRLEIIAWPKANKFNYMEQKVVCIKHCFDKYYDTPLVYIDSDVIIADSIDEIFTGPWDITATWRPEFEQEFQLLNAGVLFVNNHRTEHSKAFLEEWALRCSFYSDKSWWLDQIELVKLFEESTIDLNKGPGQKGVLNLKGKEIICRIVDSNTYNFLPEMPKPYKGYYNTRPKIVHLKSSWRKQKFLVVDQDRWILKIQERKTLGSKHPFYALCSTLWYNPKLSISNLIRKIIRRLVSALGFRRDTEISYWQKKALDVEDLYRYEISRHHEYYKFFNQLVLIKSGGKIADVGCGPIGGILDLIEAEEKWAIEPIYSKYVKKNIWMPKSSLIIRETTCEEMNKVPNNYFDTIFTMNAIDHGNDILQCFKKVYAALKKGGYFYLHVHCRKPEELNLLHKQAFNEEQLLEMLKKTGFKIIAHKVYKHDPIPSNIYRTFIGVLIK